MDTGLHAYVVPDENLPFPKMEKPQIIGCFSINTNRDYDPSAKNFRYFRMPQRFPLDLNDGYGTGKTKQEQIQDERLDNLLQFIYHHQAELLSKGDGRCIDFDFICFRGLLRLVMCAPYEPRDDFCVHATKYQGTIYLSQKETPQKRQERQNMSEMQIKTFAYGFKFEQYCMSADPNEEPKTNVPVDECEEFCCMYKTKLQGMDLLFGAEVDGGLCGTKIQNIENRDVLNNVKFVELKCSLRPNNPRQEQNFYRFKCRNWWCQSFLVGIQDLMVGYRNDKGFVNEIKHMEVRSLPKLAAQHWNPSHCADFLVRFLLMVRNIMRDVNCPHTVYEFYFEARSKKVTYKIFNGRSMHTILPDWYVALLQQQAGGTGLMRTVSNA